MRNREMRKGGRNIKYLMFNEEGKEIKNEE